jgi:cellulose synthase/poly-beta-1,6-N-acetylglucosamine synthase-like glycosyltransferase
MSSRVLFSIIIPCKEVDNYTKECIAHCRQLDHETLEILLLPDHAAELTDGVRTITTGPVSPGAKRNIGVKNSTGEFCAFIDSDAYPRYDWLTNALKYFDDPEVAGVGGPGLTPEGDTLLQKAGGYVLSSSMVGNLSSRYKTRSCGESDDIHSCNFIARKEIVEKTGGWNEKYWPGEDTLMCLAIKKLGKKLLESSDVVVYHHRRSLFKPHLKQVSRFGEHRGFFVKRFPANSVKITYFFPSLLVSFLVIGSILSLFSKSVAYVWLLIVAAYLISSLIVAAFQVREPRLLLSVWSGIIATHVVYGFFFLSGLAKRDLKR